ncbi:calcium-binding protein [Bauldia litoralis]|uniref:calcium-binding protein n=1 Tax=Bauldia litoralis TaxID=665467 RepID=UPI003266DB5F
MPKKFIGTKRSDDYEGNASVLIGKAGDDFLDSENHGEVWIWGGGGDDVLWGDDASGAHLFGGRGRDTLLGSMGDDILKGGKGRDTLESYGGADIVKGGKGADRFVFWESDIASGVDTIRDFKHGVDKILVRSPSYEGVVTYDEATGDLYFDADPGDGVSGQVFATMKAGLSFDNDDWGVIG